jgi:GT2 family glycosyltransferase
MAWSRAGCFPSGDSVLFSKGEDSQLLMSDTPKVCFVLINLNQEVLTRACIRSLQALTYPNVEIILVDNGSWDGSGRRLAAEFPSVYFLTSKVNLGFAGGNNIGIRFALEREASYVVLLNNDTIAPPGMMEPLVGAAHRDKLIGVQSCKIFFLAERSTIWYAGGKLRIYSGAGTHPGMHEEDRGQFDVFGDTDFATGCMMFLSRKALETVGLLDERYFLFLEDADWCVRARQLGFRVIYNPAAHLWHRVSATAQIESALYLYFTSRSRVLFVRKHCPWYLLPAALVSLSCFYARHFIRLLLKWGSPQRAQAVWWGMVDGVLGRTGEHGEGRLAQLVR